MSPRPDSSTVSSDNKPAKNESQPDFRPQDQQAQMQRSSSGDGGDRRPPKRVPAKLGQDLKPESSDEAARRPSIVSFQDTCDLYELDLERGERNKQLIKRKPAAFKSLRYYVVVLALVSPFVVTYSRTIINFALTDMIDPEFLAHKTSEQKMEQLTVNESAAYFDIDNSCPVSDQVRTRLLSENKIDTERARNSPGEKFQWDTFQQGLLKAAYAVGHAPLQILGGRMSEIYGSHWIISVSSLLIAILCLAAPFMAALNFYLLFGDLFMLGLVGSAMTPALITLFSDWLTPSEKSMMMSFYLISSRLGYALSSVLCGLLIQAQLSWRYVFFSAGWISMTFTVIFFLCSRSRPTDHPLISQLEVDYLASKNRLVRENLAKMKRQNNPTELKPVDSAEAVAKNGEKPKKKHQAAPWMAIMTSVPVWAFVVTKFCVKLAGDTVQIELPTYLKRVMHFSAKDNGLLNAWNYVIFCAGCFGVGALSKATIKRSPFGLSKTTIRKIFQCTASFGVSLCLLGIAFSVCNDVATNIFLMVLFAITTLGTGGEAQIPIDITERYSGTIHALGSSIALSGAIEPTLVGFILKGHAADRDSWKGVWLGASAIAFTGGLCFLFFADATIQPFDSIEPDNESSTSSNPKEPNTKLKGSLNKAFVTDETTKNQNPVNDQSKVETLPYQESRQI